MGPEESSTEPDETPSGAVLAAVAEREGVDPADLDRPLFEAVDPDALDALLARGEARVTFGYLGYEVTARSDGAVDVRPATE